MVFKFCRRVWARFVDTAVFAGALEVPRYERRRQEVLPCAWLPPKWDWVDPAKDHQGGDRADRGRPEEPHAGACQAGYDAEQVDAEIAADQARERRLGLSFRQPSASPDPAPQDEASAEDAPASPADAAPAT